MFALCPGTWLLAQQSGPAAECPPGLLQWPESQGAFLKPRMQQEVLISHHMHLVLPKEGKTEVIPFQVESQSL